MEIAIRLNSYSVKAVSIHLSHGHRLIVSVSHRTLQICDKDNMTRRILLPNQDIEFGSEDGTQMLLTNQEKYVYIDGTEV